MCSLQVLLLLLLLFDASVKYQACFVTDCLIDLEPESRFCKGPLVHSALTATLVHVLTDCLWDRPFASSLVKSTRLSCNIHGMAS